MASWLIFEISGDKVYIPIGKCLKAIPGTKYLGYSLLIKILINSELEVKYGQGSKDKKDFLPMVQRPQRSQGLPVQER